MRASRGPPEAACSGHCAGFLPVLSYWFCLLGAFSLSPTHHLSPTRGMLQRKVKYPQPLSLPPNWLRALPSVGSAERALCGLCRAVASLCSAAGRPVFFLLSSCAGGRITWWSALDPGFGLLALRSSPLTPCVASARFQTSDDSSAPSQG